MTLENFCNKIRVGAFLHPTGSCRFGQRKSQRQATNSTTTDRAL